MQMTTATLNQIQFETPLGPMRAIASDAGVLVCDFLDRRNIDPVLARVEQQHGQVIEGENEPLVKLRCELEAYFDGSGKTFTVPLLPSGTEFEIRMWNYLRTIPFGQTRTYGQQARDTGDAKAVRAVGGANGRNFIAVLIPCHRVIGAGGDLTGYGGGIERKCWLLDHERSGGLFDTKYTHATSKI